MTLPAPLTDTTSPPLEAGARAEIAALVARQRAAGGLLLKAITLVGTRVEGGFKRLPAPVRSSIEAMAEKALRRSYDLAGRSRDGALADMARTDRAHRLLASVSGAVGGLAGLPGAIAELPVATTLIFRAIQQVAAEHGEDPMFDETRLDCLRVFGAGGPGAEDDGIDTTFVAARIGMTGPALNALISRVAPRFAAVMGQKLAGQAVPLIGAVAGAGTNYAFIDYYVALAHVHFGLKRLSRRHGGEAVLDEFHRVLAETSLPPPRR